MISWSEKRKFYYGAGVVVVLLLIFSFVFFGLFYRAPTCTDGKQDGDETGVDCGGSCPNLCQGDTVAPIVYWSKFFNVSGGVYDLAAFVENPNLTSENSQAAYEFKVFDGDNLLIGTRDGETFIPKNKKFIIFEPGFVIQNRTPKYVEFDFTSFGVWQKDSAPEPDISVTYSPLSATTTSPRIDGVVSNNSTQDINEVELTAEVEDQNENTVAVSRTFVDNLTAGSSQNFVFTWPKPFGGNVINIIYRIVPTEFQ